jgi:subtilisin family serine protease
MSKTRFLSAWVLCAFAVASQAVDENPWITFGRFEAHPTRILARFLEDAGPGSPLTATVLQQTGLRIERRLDFVPGLVVLDVEANGQQPLTLAVVPGGDSRRADMLDRIQTLRASGLFQYVQPDYVKHILRDPTDEAYVDGTLWGLRNIGGQGGLAGADISARQAWDLTTGSTNVIVAIIDTGIRYTHQELVKQMWHNPKEIPGNGIDDDNNGIVDDVYGINAIAMTGDPMDSLDHGTHVSGTIGAASNDGNPHVGVNWQVQLMGCKFIGPLGGTTADAITCIGYALTNKASVMNNSWGGGPFEQSLFDAIAAARRAGVLFVAAAGNDGADNDTDPHYPANYKLDNVISVAALDRADRLAVFSDYGATTVHLGAPGVSIFSSISISDNAYELFDGTSMAAPHVTGVAALIRALYPSSSLAEVRERILRTVVPIPALAGITTTGGRLNAYKALAAAPSGQLAMSILPPEGSALLAGTNVAMFIEVTDVFSVTNATLTASIVGGGPVSFLNGGVAPDVTAGDGIYSGTVAVPLAATNLALRVVATAPGKTGVTNTFQFAVVGPPDNDDFEKAAKIPTPGGIVVANNTYATLQSREPLHAGVPSVAATLWWNWSPAADGPVLLDTAGSSFDTVLAVYTGEALTSLHEIASVNNVGSRKQGYLTFDAHAATTYRIVVGGSDPSQTGTLRLRVEPNGVPDTLAPVVAFSSPVNGLITSSNRVFVTGIAFDPQPSSSGVSEVLVKINDDPVDKKALGTTNWSTSFLLQEGYNTIQASAVDFARNQSFPVQLTVTYLPQEPSNDLFGNAQALPGASGSATGANTAATKESGEPNHANNEGGKSVWYKWTAPADGVLLLATTNSTFDTLLAVYTGDRVTNLTEVVSNDDALPGQKASKVSFGVLANVVYRIAVDGYAGSSGTVRLAYLFTPAQLFHVTLGTDSGGTVAPPSGDFIANSTLLLTATANLGYEFAGWDGTIASSDNPLSLVVDRDYALTARFRVRQATEDFESGGFKAGLDYTLNSPGSAAPWFVQSSSVAQGGFAARSGAIGAAQQSSLLLRAKMDAGVGAFAHRVSSELTWDLLEFYLNGSLVRSWSGNVDWSVFQFNVPVGTNVLEWRYVKDPSLNLGEDAAFLDNIFLPLTSATPTQAHLQLSVVSHTIGLQLKGQVDRAYVLEVSPDLLHWQPFSTNIVTGGLLWITEPDRLTHPTRFYRAVQPTSP